MGLAQEPRESETAAATLHERLVAYVHALGAEPAGRQGVWGEHSYARAGAAGAAGGARPDHKELLAAPAPRAPPPGEPLDVGGPGDLEVGPAAADAAGEPVDDDAAADWEARVVALAPSACAARLAASTASVLRALRLARLAGRGGGGGGGGDGGRHHLRAAALRVRRALAPLGLGGARAAAAAGAWLGAALAEHLPRTERGLYRELLDELHEAAPGVAARLGRPPGPAPPSPPPAPCRASGPLLLWLSVGNLRLDARWERRLRPLLRTRVVRASAPGAAPPERWAGALAASARPQLDAALEEAGPSGAVLGGCGAAAALCAALAGGAPRLRGLALLAPPLHTAEGARWPADAAAERLPCLLVAGAGGGRAAALEAGAGAARRLLLVAGADAALRLPARRRARLRLPQHALDAAVAEEVSRWASEVCEADPPEPPPPEADERAPRGPRGPPRPTAPPSGRAIEIVEGRVVSRGSGGTPLALLPPRRASPLPPGAPAPPLAAADIMQLPIVFADDEPPAPAAPAEPEPPAPVTVTSGGARGGLQYTRVIVAKRAAGARAAPAGRPVLVRRVLPRR